MDQRLAVSLVTEEETLHNRNFNPENTIIINCIPEDMAYKHLLDSITLTTRLETTDFSLERQGSMALVNLRKRFKQGIVMTMRSPGVIFDNKNIHIY